jgi:D-alanine-D-alanine ligase
MARFRKVAVLMGGVSSEREVSILSGRAVVQGLREAGYSVMPVVLTRESVDDVPAGIEAVFLALHGGYGEGGGVQADLDRIGIPYTGAGAAASRLAMDKIATKRRLAAHGVPTADYEVLATGVETTRLPLPLVVKPPREGSSVGISKVITPAAWAPALARARARDPEVLVERYIPGREMTVGVVGGEAFPAVEIIPAGGWYGFEAKYVTGDTVYAFLDPVTEVALETRCRERALQTFNALGVRGMGRIDFRVNEAGECLVLELNSLPGFTATSLLPKAAAKAGVSFSALCARIIELAACDAPCRRED